MKYSKATSIRMGFVVITMSLASFIFAGCSNNDSLVNECEQLVSEQLKAPGSAKFVNVKVSPEGQKSLYITGDVDSENGFGALLRSSFECEYDGEQMNLTYLTEG